MQTRPSLGVCGSRSSMRNLIPSYKVWVVGSQVKNSLKLPLAVSPIHLYRSHSHIVAILYDTSQNQFYSVPSRYTICDVCLVRIMKTTTGLIGLSTAWTCILSRNMLQWPAGNVLFVWFTDEMAVPRYEIFVRIDSYNWSLWSLLWLTVIILPQKNILKNDFQECKFKLWGTCL